MRLGLGLSLGSLGGLAGAGSPPKTALNAPYGFPYAQPFTIYKQDNAAVYSHSFSMDAVKPTATHTVYCGPGGDNTANGLTWATRVRSLKQAIVRANALGSFSSVVRILAQATEYLSSSVDGGGIKDSFDGQNPDRHMIIEPCDSSGNVLSDGSKIISTHRQVMPAFVATSDPNIYVSTYTTELPTPVAWDKTRLNAKGSPQALRNSPPTTTYANEAAILAGVNAKAAEFGHGALYLDATNKKLYVRLFDNRAPDANLIVGRGTAGSGAERNLYFTGAYQSSYIFWARDLQIRGGGALYSAPNQGGSEARSVTAYFADCSFGYGSLNGVSIDPAGTYTFLRCAADDNLQDGFNYDQSNGLDPGGTGVLRFHELDCTADWNGSNSQSDVSANASSAHVRVQGVRVNCKFDRTLNRAIHDILQARTWNLGVVTSNCRQGGVQSGGFASGFSPNTGETARMWLDGCASVNNDYDLEAYKGGILYHANVNTTGYVNDTVTGGTITTFSSQGVVPSAVGTLSASALSDTTVQLAFTNSGNATGYEYSVNAGSTWTALAGNKIVTGLSPSTLYNFLVRPYADHYGPASNSASATTQAPAGPVDLISNGAMSSATVWDKLFGGWSISGGLMRLSAVGAFNDSGQAVTPTVGKYYEITFTILNYSAGSITPRFEGTTTASGTTRSANGTFVERVLINTGNNRFSFITNTGPATLNIDNVSAIGPYNTSTVGGA